MGLVMGFCGNNPTWQMTIWVTQLCEYTHTHTHTYTCTFFNKVGVKRMEAEENYHKDYFH